MSVEIGGSPILSGVKLKLSDGLNVIVGPNGAGKTTLLKALAGLLPKHPKLLDAVYIPAEVPDFKSSVMKILLAKDAWFFPKEDEIKQALEALREMGIAKLAYRSFPTLSSGEKRLVLIAKALLTNKILLLDEPTANLDPLNRHVVATRVLQLSSNRQVVVATHDLGIVSFASTVTVLKEGKVFYHGQNVNSEILSEAFSIPITEITLSSIKYYVPVIF
ncbi:iron ABC transporter ATP-binding protein [Sulfolobales archaeon HS-7]|nr:iron ABC transporter ATP-binding protein [Sulfolobales archaeon HS-7]